jgi:hypothetical protein
MNDWAAGLIEARKQMRVAEDALNEGKLDAGRIAIVAAQRALADAHDGTYQAPGAAAPDPLEADPGSMSEVFIHGNSGHGHVWPRPDGLRARCGGPAICRKCALDLSRRSEIEKGQQSLLTRSLAAP